LSFRRSNALFISYVIKLFTGLFKVLLESNYIQSLLDFLNPELIFIRNIWMLKDSFVGGF